MSNAMWGGRFASAPDALLEAINASIDGGNVVYHDAEHLGIAVDTPRGLIVPVIKNAGDLNVGGINHPAAIAALQAAVEDLQGRLASVESKV